MNLLQTYKEGNSLDQDEIVTIHVCFVLRLQIFKLIAGRVVNKSHTQEPGMQINEHVYRVALLLRRITRERDLR